MSRRSPQIEMEKDGRTWFPLKLFQFQIIYLFKMYGFY